MAKPTNVLLTGLPGCGKTTVIKRVTELLPDLHLAGFYTQELKQRGRRVGFEAVGLSGTCEALAHVQSDSDIRVSRYGVEVAAFEQFVKNELITPSDSVDLYVVDEIGKMECFSDSFCCVMRQALDSPLPLLGTVAAKGRGFIAEVRNREDVELVTVTQANRESLPLTLAERMRALCSDRSGE